MEAGNELSGAPLSVAKSWDEKLRHHVAAYGLPRPSYRFTVSYEDLRALVTDSLELAALGERLRGQLEAWRAKEVELRALAAKMEALETTATLKGWLL